MLPTDKRARLVRLLGLLGSAFDGERANAAAMADRLVREAGLTWDQVIAAAGAPQHQEARASAQARKWPPWGEARWGPTVGELATYCLRSGVSWSPWERCFLEEMKAHVLMEVERLSAKQQKLLKGFHAIAKRMEASR